MQKKTLNMNTYATKKDVERIVEKAVGQFAVIVKKAIDDTVSKNEFVAATKESRQEMNQRFDALENKIVHKSLGYEKEHEEMQEVLGEHEQRINKIEDNLVHA